MNLFGVDGTNAEMRALSSTSIMGGVRSSIADLRGSSSTIDVCSVMRLHLPFRVEEQFCPQEVYSAKHILQYYTKRIQTGSTDYFDTLSYHVFELRAPPSNYQRQTITTRVNHASPGMHSWFTVAFLFLVGLGMVAAVLG